MTPLFKHAFKYPETSHLASRLFACFINRLLFVVFLKKIRRWLVARLPFMRLKSDVRDVVYLSWLVECEKAAAYIPEGIQLWQSQGKTIFTILSYQHRHFGPAFLGRFRCLLPSPKQSNWRFYVVSKPDQTQCDGVVMFVNVVVDQLPYVLGGRLGSDVMPAHLATTFKHQVNELPDKQQVIITYIEGGKGSAPSLSSQVKTVPECELPPDWQVHFGSWAQAVQYLTVQHSALVQVSDIPALAEGMIYFPVDINTVRPAVIQQVAGDFMQHLGIQHVQPFCFVVPALDFEVLNERLICHSAGNALKS